MRIALDVDGVLADVIAPWLARSNRIRPEISRDQVDDWDFWKRFGIDRYDFYAELGACWRDWRSIPPTEPGLASVSREMRKLGRVDIVTSREPQTDPFVRDWLGHHGIAYDGYVSVADGPMKADLDYDLFIDDSPLNAARMLQNGRRIVLYSQPWNASLTGIHRISSLSEVFEKIRMLSP